MADEGRSQGRRPPWARRIREQRVAREWSQSQAVRALRAHSPVTLAPDSSLIRNWKRWEAGDAEPDDFYKPLIAETFGTVTASLFPAKPKSDEAHGLLAGTGMDTLEIVSRLRLSDVSPATLEALSITTDRLCSEYAYTTANDLRNEGQSWLRRITHLLDQRLTLAQHREILVLAGWVALLVGCVEYDLGDKRSAEATRRAALSVGEESQHPEITGWAYEMQAWYSLTQGDLRGVIAASDAGRAIAPTHGVSVQLAAQTAKAWARIGDRRQTEVALEQGRALLESLPYPSNLDNHFVVDPSKFDFYAMDCYRLLGEDRLAESYARQVIELGTEANGREHQPMRNAEARVTLGVVAARQGDADAAVAHGLAALEGERKSLPSLRMSSRELATIMRTRYGDDPIVRDYRARLKALGA